MRTVGARWARHVRNRVHVEPAPQGAPRGRVKLAPHQALLEELVVQDPDVTLYKLRDALADAVGARGATLPSPNCYPGLASPAKKSLVGHD